MTTMISEEEAGIYAIRHIASQRCYVGSALKLRRRWRNHRLMLRKGCHHSVLLQNAWNKHSEQQFEFVVLETILDGGALVAHEQHWIEVLRTSNPKFGYNVCPVAYSRLGTKTSDATREKQSLAMRGFIPTQTAEFKEKARLYHLGRPHSQETKAKMSASHIGKKRAPFTEAHRQNIRLAKLGTVATEAHRAKLSKTTTAYWQRKRMESGL